MYLLVLGDESRSGLLGHVGDRCPALNLPALAQRMLVVASAMHRALKAGLSRLHDPEVGSVVARAQLNRLDTERLASNSISSCLSEPACLSWTYTAYFGIPLSAFLSFLGGLAIHSF